MLPGLLASATTSGTDNIPASAAEQSVEDRTLGLDQVFEILKNQRRRYVLQYLRMVDEQVTLSDLSEQIAAWENDKDVRQITSSERKRVYVGLYQCHLPKMDGMDVVDFNKPRATIDPGENIDVFFQYLDAPGQQDAGGWSRYYVGLSVASFLVLLASFPVEAALSVPAVPAVGVLSPLAFATLAFVHYRSCDRSDTGSTGGDRMGMPTDPSRP